MRLSSARLVLGRWHRRIALASAPVLVALLASGVVLAFRPAPVPLPATDVPRLLALVAHEDSLHAVVAIERLDDGHTLLLHHDDAPPDARALATGAAIPLPPEPAADAFAIAERVHRNLWVGLGSLVTLATFALLLLALAGPLLAPLRRPTSALGWHTALGWLGWPLVLLLPVTAAIIVLPIGRPFGVARDATPRPLARALREASDHVDLARLRFARVMPNGGSFLVHDGARGPERLMLQGGRSFDFGGPAVALARAVHAGTWAGPWGRALVVASAAAVLASLATGLASWWRRRRLRAAARDAILEG